MEKACNLVFSDFPLCDVSDGSLERRLFGDKRDPIKLKERKRSHGTRALVAINKGMVLYDMEKIGRGHFKEIGVKILPAEAGLGRRYG